MKNKILLALSLLSMQAFAGTSTADFTATATLNASCVIGATPVSFGSITPAATGDLTADGTINVTCSKGTPYVLTFSKGSGESFANRSMAGTTGNTDRLAYNLYTDPIFSTPISDNGQGALGGSGLGVLQARTIYGKLALNQYVKSDNYKDDLTVTLTY